MKVVIVKWVDSHEVIGWTFVDDLPEYKPKHILTAGFEVERTDDGIVIASSLGSDPDQVCGTMMIPKCAIVTVNEIGRSVQTDYVELNSGE
jgi:hypothetical protein